MIFGLENNNNYEYLLCARHWAVRFTEIISFNLQNNPMRSAYHYYNHYAHDAGRRNREDKYHVQCHTAIKWKNSNFNPCSLTPGP